MFVAFAIAEWLCMKKASNKIVKNIPMLMSAVGIVFGIILYAFALITYHMGAVSKSVLAENQYFATFIILPAGICLIGSIVGFGIAKIIK